MKRTTKRSTPAGKRKSTPLLRPSGESELSVAEEEMIESLLAHPPGKKRSSGGKSAAKRAASGKSSRSASAAKRSRTRVSKKPKARKSPKRK